jgi:hypothetical protein
MTQGHTATVTISLAKLLFYDCPHEFLIIKLHKAVFFNPNFYLDADLDPERSGLALKRCGSQADPTKFFLQTPALSNFCGFFQ